MVDRHEGQDLAPVGTTAAEEPVVPQEQGIRYDENLPEDKAALAYRVRRALEENEPLRGTRAPILVTMRDDVVVLRGRVRTRSLKSIAASIAARVPGVGRVENELVADPDVEQDVAVALSRDPVTREHRVLVSSYYGVVHLSGDVPDDEVAQRAATVAAGVPTVARVVSHLVVVR
ncbi:MAG TPA: BON domain-containing protein [Chloroflexota bacterium]